MHYVILTIGHRTEREIVDSGGTCYCTDKLYSAEFKPWDYIISKNFLVFFFGWAYFLGDLIIEGILRFKLGWP